MKFITSLIIVLFAFNLNASLPIYNQQYERYSENNKYYLISIPYADYGENGKTYLIEKDTKKIMFSIDKYLINNEVYISNSGKCIIEIKHSLGESNKNNDIIKLTFIDNKTVCFNSNKLLSKKYDSTLENEIIWIKHLYIQKDILNVLTIENKVISIDVNLGQVIKVKKIYQNKIKTFTKIEIQHSLIYSKFEIIPNTNFGQSITSILEEKLSKKIIENKQDSSLYISIDLLIDRKGKAEIRNIWVDDVFQQKFIKNNELTSEINKLLSNLIFDTNTIPSFAEKWIFKQKIYLK
jgi:hypothetical protein